MTRKATLPKITECIDPMPRASSLAQGQMLEALFAFALIGALALAHVHLQFMRTDAQMQHRALQIRLTDLKQEEVRLQRQNEGLCDQQRLSAVAQAEHMKEIDVRSQRVAVVPTALRKKYETPVRDASAAPEQAIAMLSAEHVKVSDKVLSLLDAGKAYAATLPETQR